MKHLQDEVSAYQAITTANFERFPEWQWLEPEYREAVQVVGQVLPFRTNTYVTRRLLDWNRVPDDPIYRLTFPMREMLSEDDYERIRDLLFAEKRSLELKRVVSEIHRQMNPHPAGQLSHNVPELDGHVVDGVQHKYRETVLFFPAQGQTCHAFCTYCFRWPQFMRIPGLKFQARDSRELVAYLKGHREVTDLLVTGGDPMVMRTKILRRFLEPVMGPGLEHLQTVRIGTKALGYWPARFISDPDSEDLLRFFEEIVDSGRHLAFMAHFSHPVELETEEVREAIRRIRNTGAEIRTQAPLVRHVNDDARLWSAMWRKSVRLGMVPYYMFVERDTGPREYFKVSLHRAQRIYREAIQRVSGLSRTVRGPSMSTFPGKVQILGTCRLERQKVFALQFLQARNPAWVGRPFFAEFDSEAAWLDELRPAFGRRKFFFEGDGEQSWAETTVA